MEPRQKIVLTNRRFGQSSVRTGPFRPRSSNQRSFPFVGSSTDFLKGFPCSGNADSTTSSAALRYRSTCDGDRDSLDPMCSKPCHRGSSFRRTGYHRIVVHAEKVLYRVCILLATEPVVSDGAALRHPGRLAFRQPSPNPLDYFCQLLRLRLRLRFRRHLARVHPEADFAPALGFGLQGEAAAQHVEPEFPFLDFAVVATVAVGSEEGSNDGIEGVRHRGRCEIRPCRGNQKSHYRTPSHCRIP